INGDRLNGEWELSANDEVYLGRTRLLFVDDMAQLPDLPVPTAPVESMLIKKRLSNTRFLTPSPPVPPVDETQDETPTGPRHSLSHDLALLYRLALNMGSAGSYQELLAIVLEGLLEAIPAD